MLDLCRPQPCACGCGYPAMYTQTLAWDHFPRRRELNPANLPSQLVQGQVPPSSPKSLSTASTSSSSHPSDKPAFKYGNKYTGLRRKVRARRRAYVERLRWVPNGAVNLHPPWCDECAEDVGACTAPGNFRGKVVRTGRKVKRVVRWVRTSTAWIEDVSVEELDMTSEADILASPVVTSAQVSAAGAVALGSSEVGAAPNSSTSFSFSLSPDADPEFEELRRLHAAILESYWVPTDETAAGSAGSKRTRTSTSTIVWPRTPTFSWGSTRTPTLSWTSSRNPTLSWGSSRSPTLSWGSSRTTTQSSTGSSGPNPLPSSRTSLSWESVRSGAAKKTDSYRSEISDIVLSTRRIFYDERPMADLWWWQAPRQPSRTMAAISTLSKGVKVVVKAKKRRTGSEDTDEVISLLQERRPRERAQLMMPAHYGFVMARTVTRSASLRAAVDGPRVGGKVKPAWPSLDDSEPSRKLFMVREVQRGKTDPVGAPIVAEGTTGGAETGGERHGDKLVSDDGSRSRGGCGKGRNRISLAINTKAPRSSRSPTLQTIQEHFPILLDPSPYAFVDEPASYTSPTESSASTPILKTPTESSPTGTPSPPVNTGYRPNWRSSAAFDSCESGCTISTYPAERPDVPFPVSRPRFSDLIPYPFQGGRYSGPPLNPAPIVPSAQYIRMMRRRILKPGQPDEKTARRLLQMDERRARGRLGHAVGAVIMENIPGDSIGFQSVISAEGEEGAEGEHPHGVDVWMCRERGVRTGGEESSASGIDEDGSKTRDHGCISDVGGKSDGHGDGDDDNAECESESMWYGLERLGWGIELSNSAMITHHEEEGNDADAATDTATAVSIEDIAPASMLSLEDWPFRSFPRATYYPTREQHEFVPGVDFRRRSSTDVLATAGSEKSGVEVAALSVSATTTTSKAAIIPLPRGLLLVLVLALLVQAAWIRSTLRAELAQVLRLAGSQGVQKVARRSGIGDGDG